jgi:alanine racemase
VRPVKWAEVDVSRLRDNAAAICRQVGTEVAVMAMIKANGYGHGWLLAAEAFLAGGARWLGVSSAEEALQLRHAGMEAPVLIVGWSHPDNHSELIAAGIDMTVYDVSSVASIRAAAREAGRPARVHVKIDSGMGRLGARPEHVEEVAAALEAARDHVVLTGVFTHFADADGSDTSFSELQHTRFLELAAVLLQGAPDALIHCANSAAVLRLPHTRHHLVRPGIALYGYPPPVAGGTVAVKPAMTVVATVTHVKTVHTGDTVGYGRTWRAAGDTRIATVAAGYADGVNRAHSNRGRLLIHGTLCPIAGRVSMDQLAVDVSELDAVQPGDEAILFGERDGVRLGADQVAATIGTIPYEVLCAVSARVSRIAVNTG